jgi:hypothetical protein
VVHTLADVFTNFIWALLGIAGAMAGLSSLKDAQIQGLTQVLGLILFLAGIVIILATAVRSLKTIRFIRNGEKEPN